MGQKMVMKELGGEQSGHEATDAVGDLLAAQEWQRSFTEEAERVRSDPEEAAEHLAAHLEATDAYERRFGAPPAPWRRQAMPVGTMYLHPGRGLCVAATVEHCAGGWDVLIVSVSTRSGAKAARYELDLVERVFVPRGGRITTRNRRPAPDGTVVTYLEGVVPCDAAPRGDA